MVGCKDEVLLVWCYLLLPKEMTEQKIIKKTYLPTVFLALLPLLFILHTKEVVAQESTGISISPPTFELSANPGDVIQNTIRVTNLSSSPLTVGTSTRNFTAVGEEGAVGLTEEEITFSLASWITVDPPEATIEPDKNAIFTFTTSVPPNAEPGGHFGSVVFMMGGSKPDQTGAAIRQEVASLVLLRVAGNVNENADILTFATPGSFYEYGPIDFEIRVKNEGNVHVKPTGTITITNMFGRQVDQIQIDSRNVLPNATRKMEANWENRLLIGRYTATAVLAYGRDGETMVATTSFSGFPYKVGGAIFLALLVLLYILYRMRHRLMLAAKILFGKS
jgi:hypothetical protein